MNPIKLMLFISLSLFIPLSYGGVSAANNSVAAVKPVITTSSSKPSDTAISVPLSKATSTVTKAAVVTKKPAIKKPHVETKRQQEANLFKTEPGPPPGFAAAILDESQTTIVNVVYGGQNLTEMPAEFTATSIKLSAPKILVNKIPGLSNKKLVLKALEQSLPTHEDNLCVYGDNRPYCKSITPQVAGVIFDPNTYHAYLFINPKYITLAAQNKIKLPDSNAGFSVQVQNNLNTAGSNNNQIYTLSNTSVFGFGDGRFLVGSNYTKNISQGQATNQFQVNHFAYGYYNSGLLYQAGMLSTYASGNFLLNRSILGATITNQNTEGQPVEYGIASPLTVYLTTRSQVRVLRNGSLIGVETLSSGKHQLNTAGYPNGSYDVTIVIKGEYGQVSKQTKHFVKESGLPPLDKPTYHLGLGLEQDNFLQTTDSAGDSDNLTIPTVQTKYSDKPVIALSEDKSFAYNWGLQSTIISNFKQAYLGSVLSYYIGQFQLSPEALLSTDGEYGAAFNGQYSGNRFSANLLAARLVSDETIDEINNNDFYPLSTNNLQVQTGVGYSFPDGLSLQLSGNWLRNIGSSTEHSYSFTANKMLLSTASTNLNVSLTATESDTDKTINLGLTLNIFNENYLASLEAGYDGNNADAANGAYTDNYTGNASLSRNFRWGPLRDADINGSVAHNSQGQTYSAGGSYESPVLQTTGSITHNVNTDNSGQSSQTTNYTVSLASSLAYSDGTFGFGYSQGWFSGVLIDVRSSIPSKVKVFVNGNYSGMLKTNDPEPIFLQPYATYSISILPVGATLFSYDTAGKPATIYRGNIKYLSWTLAKQYILFGQIVNAKGKPLKNALLVRKDSYDSTGEYGFLQASITTVNKTLKFEYKKGSYCTVTLPTNLKIQNDFVQLEKPMVCE